MACDLPVARSFADTFTMPFASRSKVTSIWGTPRGAEGMPTRWNLPSVRLSGAIGRSPCSTWISTWVWLSEAVEKVSLLRVGIVVFLSMRVVITPPSVSMPSESGVTSRRSRSLTSPERTPAWMAAPMATTSSGLTPLWGSFPKSAFTSSWTFGMRVEPPTSTTSSIWDGWRPASFRHCRTGPSVFSSRSPTSCSSFARVSFRERCLGPEASAVTKGRLISVSIVVRQLALGLLRGLLQPLERHLVLREVDPLVLLELRDDPLDHALVEVVAAEVGVAVRGLDLDDALAHLEDRDVEGAAAEVVDGDRLVLLLVEAVGERRRRRLVDDAQDLEARRSGRRPSSPGAASR